MSQVQRPRLQEHGFASHPRPQPAFDVKRLQCWYWTNGGCTWSDNECRYAHRHTGKVAEKPIMRSNGYSVAGRNATVDRPVYRRWQGRGDGSLEVAGEKRDDAMTNQHERGARNSPIANTVPKGSSSNARGFEWTTEHNGSDSKRPGHGDTRGRRHPREPENSDVAGHRAPESRSRSPYTGPSLRSSRERSPRRLIRTVKVKVGRNHEQLGATTDVANYRQPLSTIKNDFALQDVDANANIKHKHADQIQATHSNTNTSAKDSYTITNSLPNTNIRAETEHTVHAEAVYPPAQTIVEPLVAQTKAMEQLLEAIQQPGHLNEQPEQGKIDGLQVPPPTMQQLPSHTGNYYESMQSDFHRPTYGYHESASTMVSMTMTQYGQMRATEDHMQRELYHYRRHHRRSEQVIEYQSILLTEAQSLLENGKKLLADEGHLAMDLSQKIQRGETISPDLVTDAWLGATDMLRQADSFSVMLDEWSRAVSVERSRHTSTSTNITGEPAQPAQPAQLGLTVPEGTGQK